MTNCSTVEINIDSKKEIPMVHPLKNSESTYESIHSIRLGDYCATTSKWVSCGTTEWSRLRLRRTDEHEEWAMFCRKQVYKQEGKGCTWQPRDRTETHASQARLSLSPHGPTHPTTLHGPFLTAGRPSLRTSLLAVHSPKITEIVEKSAFPMDRSCGPLWRLEEQRDSLSKWNVIVCRRVFASLDRSRIAQRWFDFCALFNLIAL